MSSNNIFTLTILIVFSPLIGKLINNLVYLFKLYIKSKKGNNLIDLLNRLTFREFKIWAGEYLSHIGYTNIVLPPFDEWDKNIICIKNNSTYYVKCNRSNGTSEISVKALEQFLGELISESINNGLIITTNTIPDDVRNFIDTIPKPYSIDILSLSEISASEYSYNLNIN